MAVAAQGATLSVLRSDGVSWRIELFGVRYLRADEFREGNIICNLEAYSGTQPPRSVIESLLGAPQENVAGEYSEKHRVFIDQMIAHVIEGRLTLVVLTPSYGCELSALCERLKASAVD
ncbi:MAG: hypothetical protein Q7T84_11440 [Phenylobacterium sp.]|uniref:hypothetical protein n=1 Tax=Phenylobacterium sp. TaxID=1871053 RepID=UPI002725AC0D|nr:hypothetical protein [Phenylobacterium sp.]MDO9431901.1 hypothetical protein [Phenylobacterium sp.]